MDCNGNTIILEILRFLLLSFFLFFKASRKMNNAPQSGPVYVVLQPNLDDANTDDLYYPPQDEDASHLQFLRDNPDGFLRVARIHTRGHKVVLVQSRKPDPQLYIAKQCNSFDYSPNEPYDTLAREVRISTLDAKDVQHTIPSGRQFAETLAYQRLERESRPDALSVLYLRYYNGGGLDGIAERYRVTNQPVPETLIWHVCKSRQFSLRSQSRYLVGEVSFDRPSNFLSY